MAVPSGCLILLNVMRTDYLVFIHKFNQFLKYSLVFLLTPFPQGSLSQRDKTGQDVLFF